MKRTLITQSSNLIGETIEVVGWIQTVRSHGKIAFFDIYDRSGMLQVVAATEETVMAASELQQRTAVRVTGLIKNRGERYINPNISTGKIEMEAKSIK
ncbi:MAG: aspartate--tRNA ligase, partial [Patescibacteria group bacterium]|nr:aspartate--tRNA ligase [Patescibacteria group bacterium]